MRIEPRVRAQAFEVPPPRDMAADLRAAELQAQAAQTLQRNPALQAFQGESTFEGAGAVQAAQPQNETRIPGGLQPGDLNDAPWPGVREWLKTLLGLK
jgi:hypothetical protein